MRKIFILLFFAPLLMATTCDDDDRYHPGYPCTEIAVAGLNVTVTLDGNANITSDGITVTARSGNYIEDLVPDFSGAPMFSGAIERTGSYIITANKQGYETFVSQPVNVSSDRCHVIPQQLTVNLLPNP